MIVRTSGAALTAAPNAARRDHALSATRHFVAFVAEFPWNLGAISRPGVRVDDAHLSHVIGDGRAPVDRQIERGGQC